MSNKWIRFGLLAAGGLVLGCIIFGAGLYVGRLTLRGNAPPDLPPRGFLFSGSHGAAGTLLEIQDKALIVQLRDGGTQTISLDSNTRVERNMKKANLTDLQIGDRVLVVGAPDAERKIKARLIRVVDWRTPPAAPKKP